MIIIIIIIIFTCTCFSNNNFSFSFCSISWEHHSVSSIKLSPFRLTSVLSMFLWDSRDATEKNKNNGTVADENQEAPL